MLQNFWNWDNFWNRKNKCIDIADVMVVEFIDYLSFLRPLKLLSMQYVKVNICYKVKELLDWFNMKKRKKIWKRKPQTLAFKYLYIFITVFTDVIATDKEEVAFKDLDVAILVGSMPRRDGMERKDLLKANVKIFKCQGTALEKYAKKSVKVTNTVVYGIFHYQHLMLLLFSFYVKTKLFALPQPPTHFCLISLISVCFPLIV